MLITQNFDDLQNRVIRESQVLAGARDPHCNLTANTEEAFMPHIYEINGNMRFMHCNNEELDCSKRIIKVPEPEDFEAAAQSATET